MRCSGEGGLVRLEDLAKIVVAESHLTEAICDAIVGFFGSIVISFIF